MAVGTDWLPPFQCTLERSVQDGRRNFLLKLSADVAHRFEQSVEVKATHGGSKDDWRVIQEEQMFLHPAAELGEGGHDVRSALGLLRVAPRSEEHTSELQSLRHLVCRLLL